MLSFSRVLMPFDFRYVNHESISAESIFNYRRRIETDWVCWTKSSTSLRYEYAVGMVCKVFFFLCKTDVNECNSKKIASTSHANATCKNIPGTYRCRCAPGLAGTGITLWG